MIISAFWSAAIFRRFDWFGLLDVFVPQGNRESGEAWPHSKKARTALLGQPLHPLPNLNPVLLLLVFGTPQSAQEDLAAPHRPLLAPRACKKALERYRETASAYEVGTDLIAFEEPDAVLGGQVDSPGGRVKRRFRHAG